MTNKNGRLNFQKYTLTVGLLIGIFALPIQVSAALTPVFINEAHYDNIGKDQNEGFEIAGPVGTDLGGWDLVLYRFAPTEMDVNRGVRYDTIHLSGEFEDEANGFGFRDFSAQGLQNGPQDGLALVNNLGTVVQFLSYEGVITATDGPANGLVSTDIGVMESGSTDKDYSLQLTGFGNAYEHFSWLSPREETFGHENYQQTFGTPVPIPNTFSLMGLGLIGILLFHRYKRPSELPQS